MRNELESLVLGWADKHNLDPNFFMIENIEEEWCDVPKELIEEEVKNREKYQSNKILRFCKTVLDV